MTFSTESVSARRVPALLGSLGLLGMLGGCLATTPVAVNDPTSPRLFGASAVNIAEANSRLLVCSYGPPGILQRRIGFWMTPPQRVVSPPAQVGEIGLSPRTSCPPTLQAAQEAAREPAPAATAPAERQAAPPAGGASESARPAPAPSRGRSEEDLELVRKANERSRAQERAEAEARYAAYANLGARDVITRLEAVITAEYNEERRNFSRYRQASMNHFEPGIRRLLTLARQSQPPANASEKTVEAWKAKDVRPAMSLAYRWARVGYGQWLLVTATEGANSIGAYTWRGTFDRQVRGDVGFERGILNDAAEMMRVGNSPRTEEQGGSFPPSIAVPAQLAWYSANVPRRSYTVIYHQPGQLFARRFTTSNWGEQAGASMGAQVSGRLAEMGLRLEEARRKYWACQESSCPQIETLRAELAGLLLVKDVYHLHLQGDSRVLHRWLNEQARFIARSHIGERADETIPFTCRAEFEAVAQTNPPVGNPMFGVAGTQLTEALARALDSPQYVAYQSCRDEVEYFLRPTGR